MDQNNRVQETFTVNCKGRVARIYGTNGKEWFGRIVDCDTFTYMVRLGHYDAAYGGIKEGPETLLLYKSGLVGIEVEMDVPDIPPAESFSPTTNRKERREQQRQQAAANATNAVDTANTTDAATAVNNLKKMLSF